MKKSHLMVQIGIALAIVVLYNPLVNRAMKNAPAYKMAAEVKSMQPATDVFLGNSLMEAGYSEATFKSIHPDRKPMQLALGSTLTPEHYCILETSKEQPGATVYYGFFSTALTDPRPTDWSEISGNRLVGVITADSNTWKSVYAPNDPRKAAQISAATLSPVFFNRLQIWAKTELMRRKVGALGMPTQDTNEFGNVKDFAEFGGDQHQEKAKALQDAQQKAPFIDEIQKIIDLCHARKLNLIFINMPANSTAQRNLYRSKEWQLYQTHLNTLIKAAGAKFIDATAWNPDGDFSDGFHLSPNTGGIRFTKHLLETAPKS